MDTTSDNNIKLSGSDIDVHAASNTVNIRGFNVSYVLLENDQIHTANLRLCVDDTFHVASINFRWLQTTAQVKAMNRDRILLDNIEISAQERILLRDDFHNQSTNGIK